jgi:cyclophilin family peptidyl-prolyl cis-trans isomerase
MKQLFICLILALAVTACKEKTEDPAPVVQEDPKEDVIEMETPYGKMYIWLYKATPLHRSNFLKLADSGYFNNTTFHRVIPNFMIQGGDPNSKDSDTTNDGTGGPNYTIPAEIKPEIKHKRGVIAAARTNNPAKASSGSQFYISVSTSGTASLDNNYTVFGFVMKGMEYADNIVSQPRNLSNNRPFQNQAMQVKVIKKTLKEIKDEYGYTPEF